MEKQGSYSLQDNDMNFDTNRGLYAAIKQETSHTSPVHIYLYLPCLIVPHTDILGLLCFSCN